MKLNKEENKALRALDESFNEPYGLTSDRYGHIIRHGLKQVRKEEKAVGVTLCACSVYLIIFVLVMELLVRQIAGH